VAARKNNDMAGPKSERLAILEQRVKDMAKQLDENTADTKAIRKTLDNLTGGKQALMWVTGVIVSVTMAIATWLGLHHR
jgi:hypothetical protein